MQYTIIVLLVTGCLLSLAAGYFTWKHAHFFLARRDYYVNSKFDLLKKKVSMSLSVAVTILLLTLQLAGAFTGKPEKNREMTSHIKNKSSVQAYSGGK